MKAEKPALARDAMVAIGFRDLGLYLFLTKKSLPGCLTV